MTDLNADVWASRDLPVLVAVAGRIDSGHVGDSDEDLAERTGLSTEDVRLAALALQRRGLVAIERAMSGTAWFMNVSAEAYFLTGLHPDGDDEISRLIAAIRSAADTVADPDERSRLRRLADQVAGIG